MLKYRVNMNDDATVVLTEAGAKIYNETPRAGMPIRLEAGDKVTEQLWEIFRIFGGKNLSRPSVPIHFDQNVMEIEVWNPRREVYELPGGKEVVNDPVEAAQAWANYARELEREIAETSRR